MGMAIHQHARCHVPLLVEGEDPILTHRAVRALARPQMAELWGMTGKEV